jgi:hypothetical protein
MNAIFLALAISQPAPVPRPPEVPVIEETCLSYWDAYEKSKQTGKAVILYVGTKPNDHDWGITAYERKFTRHNGQVETKAILITKNGRGTWLYPDMTKAEMQRTVDAFFAEGEVRQAPQAQPALFRSAPVRAAANC